MRAVQEAGGWLTESDLQCFNATWLEPLRFSFRGYQVHMPPPPSLGFQTLESLNILSDIDLEGLGHNSSPYLHTLLEAIKLASADRTRYVRDGLTTIEVLLDPEYGSTRRALIDPNRAACSEGERYRSNKTDEVQPGDPMRYARDHTTHFEAADAGATWSRSRKATCTWPHSCVCIIETDCCRTDLEGRSPSVSWCVQRNRHCRNRRGWLACAALIARTRRQARLQQRAGGRRR